MRTERPFSSAGISPYMRGSSLAALSRLRRLMRTGKNSHPIDRATAPPTKTPPCATPTTTSGLKPRSTSRDIPCTSVSNCAHVSSRNRVFCRERSWPKLSGGGSASP